MPRIEAAALAQPPRVSVLMPVYNAERYLTAAAESVLGQTFGDFEFLALDDGSTDRSLELLRRCAGRDARMRVISGPNRGLVGALNELLAQARGEYVARMDADDVSRPRRFERQVDFLREHPECVAVGSRALFIDPEGLPLYEDVDHYSHEQIERALLRPMVGILHPSVVMRRAAVERVGGYRSDYLHVEDLDLFLRLAEVGQLANLPEVLLEYRVHAASVSHSHTLEQHLSGLRAVRDTCARRGLQFLRGDELRQPRIKVESESELHRKWAWMALGAKNLVSARKHAWRAMAGAPSNIENWRVLACAVRGH
jgi:glycosyltransferase involved in cell wall biosynthesis